MKLSFISSLKTREKQMIFQYAIKSNVSSIIEAHNHPSGNKEPSESDLKTTKKIKEAKLSFKR